MVDPEHLGAAFPYAYRYATLPELPAPRPGGVVPGVALAGIVAEGPVNPFEGESEDTVVLGHDAVTATVPLAAAPPAEGLAAAPSRVTLHLEGVAADAPAANYAVYLNYREAGPRHRCLGPALRRPAHELRRRAQARRRGPPRAALADRRPPLRVRHHRPRGAPRRQRGVGRVEGHGHVRAHDAAARGRPGAAEPAGRPDRVPERLTRPPRPESGSWRGLRSAPRRGGVLYAGPGCLAATGSCCSV